MAEVLLPRYPVYVPSKGRYETGHTARFLSRDGVPFYLVVEAPEADEYRRRYPAAEVLVLPFRDQGLIAARNWVKAHATEAGHARHWQLDDNMTRTARWWRGRCVPCSAGVALRVCEDLADRYENVAVAGLNYEMFVTPTATKQPFLTNVRVYSCSLVLNALPHRWRQRYNDDTDLCLQVLADGWCTILVNAFSVRKIRTMVVKGGNTDDLYQADGRLRMARSLERVWPYVVTTKRRFGRPQHVVRHAWCKFDNQLVRRKDVDWAALEARGTDEYGLQLEEVRPVQSAHLRRWVDEHRARHHPS